MLVSINGTDITKHILASTYKINSLPVYSEWMDGNYVMHRDIHRYKVQGSFELKFPQDGGKAYSEFVNLFNKNSIAGLLMITVFVNNTEEYKTIEAYHEMSVVMAKNFNVKTYKKITFKLEER